MKAYKGSFKKKNGESRHMTFARLIDLPDETELFEDVFKE